MTTIRKTYGGDVVQFKALPDADGQKGRFEALVSVVGNIDYQGDRVMSGAFDKTLKTWRESGDPIPVIFSHDWGDPNAFIGSADPNDCEEVKAGQKDGYPHGGLLIRGRIFTEKAYAAQVYDLLKARLIKQWSFAYDVFDEEIADDKANNLNELGLLEVGPCLSGANPLTDTLGIKSQLDKAEKRDESLEMFERAMKVDPELAKMLFRDLVPKTEEIVDMEIPVEVQNAQYVDPELAKALYGTKSPPWHIEERGGEFCVVKDEDGSVEKCHPTREEAEAHMGALYANVEDAKTKAVFGEIDGTQESTQGALRNALQQWGQENGRYADVAGTYPDHVIVWSMSEGGEEYLSFPYTEEDGKISLGEPSPVDVRITVKDEDPETKGGGDDDGGGGDAHGGTSDEDKTSSGSATVTVQLAVADGVKVGRVIGARALGELKALIDDWADRVNGDADPVLQDEDKTREEEKDDPDADLKARIAEITRWSGAEKE